MSSDDKLHAATEAEVGQRGYRKIDKVAYTGIGIYSLINIAWIVWASSGAGFGVFDTAGLIGIFVPIFGVIALIVFQCSSPRNRFSILANVLSSFAVIGWFFVVGMIVAAASAAV